MGGEKKTMSEFAKNKNATVGVDFAELERLTSHLETMTKEIGSDLQLFTNAHAALLKFDKVNNSKLTPAFEKVLETLAFENPEEDSNSKINSQLFVLKEALVDHLWKRESA